MGKSFFLCALLASGLALTYASVPTCPAENGELATLLPHEDCTKFWICDFGEAVEKECKPGLHFNPILLVCDYPENAGCTGTGKADNDGDSDSAAPECPEVDGEYPIFAPHEDCTKFWQCYRGEALEMECPAGLHFSPTLNICDYPENAGCTGTGKVDTVGDSNSRVPECSVDNGEFTYLLPHEDCTKYWLCEFGEAYEMDCPAGLHFNPDFNVCDFPENAGCTGTGRT